MVVSGEESNKGIDTTAGGLVWVRRRNGSWWPGQILDPDELTDGFVPTPRAGTPVKLLGRDDASVDWYNLEKSKRVKSFRCKEYEVCIKRVQTMASLSSIKRPAKYARREDAILHALELENARLGRDHPDSSTARDAASEDDENKDSEPGHVDSEDDRVKRMRGLEDLGVAVKSTRKRAQAQESSKRKKRRPLTKVMECASMVPVPGEDSNESRKNSSVVINNNSDSNGVSSENVGVSLKHKVKDGAAFIEPTVPENGSFEKLLDAPVTEGKNSSEDGGGGAPSSSLGNEACNEWGSTRSGTATSGWRLKGKRKSRSRKRYLNIKTQTSVAGAGREGPSARSRRNGPPDNADDGTSLAKSTGQRVLPLRQSRFTTNRKYDNSDYSLDNRAASGLYDVKVEVEMGYRPQHVPYISLMSQLTGRPITGHPLQVTVLKDEDEKLELEPGLNEDIPAPVNAAKRRGRGRKLKRKLGSSRSQAAKSKSKRIGLLSKKTRKLSSITGPNRKGLKKTKVTKPIVEKVKSSSVACVPLTVVFSRINADLNITVRAPPCLNVTSSV